MRGSDERTGSLYSFVDLDEGVPAKHPLRKVRQIVNDALATFDADFSKLDAAEGRPSIAPERLLRASLLQAFYSIRSERQLMEQLDYNLLFRWFVGLGRRRSGLGANGVHKEPRPSARRRRLGEVHGRGARTPRGEAAPVERSLSVDGTLVEARASLKSFRAKDGSDDRPGPGRNGERKFHGETRANDTHASTTDPDAKLYRKSSNTAAKLCYIGHALAENRHGLIVQADATKSSSRAEREAALVMVERAASGN